MGYTGVTPNSLFIYPPTQSEISDEWRVLVTPFETGWEQRRAKWVNPKMKVSMRYPRGSNTSDKANDIWRFWRAMQGPLRSFDLPLFGRNTTVESDFTAMDTQMGVADTGEFTTDLTSRYNMIYVENANRGFDTFVVASVVDGTTINVQSARFDNINFSPGEPVSGVIRARFMDQIFSFDYLVALMTTAGIEFTEVRS